MTHSRNQIGFFPQSSFLDQLSCEQSGHDSRNGGYSMAQQYGLPLTKTNLAIATAECPICQ